MPPALWTSPKQGRAEALQSVPSGSAQTGDAPPGPGLLAVERCHAKQGLGWYLKAAMASMACCRTAVCRWSLGSSCSSSCRAQPGWDLSAASTPCHQTWRWSAGLMEPPCPHPSAGPQNSLPPDPGAGFSSGRASPQHLHSLRGSLVSTHACHHLLPPSALSSQRASAWQPGPLPQCCRVSPHLDTQCQFVSVAEDVQALQQVLVPGGSAQLADASQKIDLLGLVLAAEGQGDKGGDTWPA